MLFIVLYLGGDIATNGDDDDDDDVNDYNNEEEEHDHVRDRY